MPARIATRVIRRKPAQSVRRSGGGVRGLAAIPGDTTPSGSTTMPAEKINGTPPRTAAAMAPSSDAAIRAVDGHERVLGEISHELGNFFHKLYYWAEFLQEKRPPAEDGTGAQMLERTIRSLEDFLRSALEFFHPVQLACLPMPAADVASALVGPLRARLNGTPFVMDACGSGGTILVDPARLSQAWSILTRVLLRRVGPGSRVRLVVHEAACGSRSGVRFGFAIEGGEAAAPTLDTAMDAVEWAFAERIVALHGGELVRGASEGAEALAIVLPSQC